MGLQGVLSDGLTVQSLATIILGGVSLAAKYLLNAQTCLTRLVDNSLRSSTMSISSLFSSAFQVPGPTTGSGIQYLVCLSLVSYEPIRSSSLVRT